MMKKRILVVFGTRPEAVKLAPFILTAQKDDRFDVIVCSTGQHREMLKPVLKFFNIQCQYDLDLMKPGQSLIDISMGVMAGLQNIIKTEKVDSIVVQGDTTTCFIARLVAFYNQIHVTHVEAGLRSHDMYSPFPEEFNRRATGLVANLHLAPTETSAKNLINEGFDQNKIFVTGNTGIDALLFVDQKIKADAGLQQEFAQKYAFLNANKKLILVTLHRRESFGETMENVMQGIVELAKDSQYEFLFPIHMNPQVRKSAEKVMGHHSQWVGSENPQHNIWLIDPIDYIPFVYVMNKAHLILTDSGGIQEEAPSLGKPILVARENTERPEAIEAGTSCLVPLKTNEFVQFVRTILDDKDRLNKMGTAKNPYGDGTACVQSLNHLYQQLVDKK